MQLRDATPFWGPPNNRVVMEKTYLQEVLYLKIWRMAEQIHKMTFQREIARSYDVVQSVVTSKVQLAKNETVSLVT
jgi:hypothetical protein